MVSRISTKFLSFDLNKLRYRLKLILQEKQAGYNSDLIIEGIVALADNLLEYKCISKKEHNLLLSKCFN